MVAPDARRRGIGSALLDAAVPLCRERSDRQPLLVVPRPSIGGKRLALRRGGTLDHSEHHLVLSGEPTSGPHRPEISLRAATAADVPLVVSLLDRGFGWSGPDDLGDRLQRTALIELRGAVVGTLFLERDDEEEASIFGFVVEPSLQGRGIGRAALRQACEQLRADGARRISLDVDVANDRALGLCTSIGFTPVTTEDYFALPFS
jgi:ribosomal protein S18 acetylase RimI-like enzyme